MKNSRTTKFIVLLTTQWVFAYSHATITVVKTKRTITQEQAMAPIDDSDITELSEQVILDPIAINDEIETIEEFEPKNEFDDYDLIKEKLTFSEGNNSEQELPN